MASEAADLDEVPLSECRVVLVVFMPFVAFSEDQQLSVPEDAEAPEPSAALADGQCWVHVGGGPPETASSRQDLALWDYSDSFVVELTSQLPHRQWRLEVPVADAPRPLGVGVGVEEVGTWVPQSCAVEIWSTGIGHLAVVYRLSGGGAATWSDLRGSVGGVDTKRDLLQQGHTVVVRSLAAPFTASTEPPPVLRSRGRSNSPQWVQSVFVIEAPRGTGTQRLDAVAAEVTDDGARLPCRVDGDRALVRLGVEAAIVTTPGATDLRDAVIRVVATQTSVWAAAIEFDRVLMKQLRKVTVRGARLSTKDLERRSIVSLEVFERVQRFRASVSMMGVHLATVDKDVWDQVNKEWRLVDQLESLETKLNAVEHVHRHLIDTLTTRQGRVLNQVVLLITLLSLASFFLTSWEFTHKELNAFSGASLLVVLAAVSPAIVLYLYLRHRVGRTTVGFQAVKRLRSGAGRR